MEEKKGGRKEGRMKRSTDGWMEGRNKEVKVVKERWQGRKDKEGTP
jgi:hypothetical protein